MRSDDLADDLNGLADDFAAFAKTMSSGWVGHAILDRIGTRLRRMGQAARDHGAPAPFSTFVPGSAGPLTAFIVEREGRVWLLRDRAGQLLASGRAHDVNAMLVHSMSLLDGTARHG